MSIRIEQALNTWKSGRERLEQELELQNRRRTQLEQNMLSAQQRRAAAERRLRLKAIREDLAMDAENRWRRMRDEFAGDRLINLDKRIWQEDDATLATEEAGVDPSEERQTLSAAVAEMVSLEKELTNCVRRLRQLENDLGHGFERFKFDARDLIDTIGKMSSQTISVDPNLAVALYVRISESDLVVTAMDHFTLYRRWMDFEFEAAQALQKPVIAVVPSEAGIPRDLSIRRVTTVRSDCELCEAVGRYIRRERW
jgi:hypothetical protein